MDTMGRRLADAVARFEEDWRPAPPPGPVLDFVARTPDDLAGPLLRELACADYARRWLAGIGLPVEVYLRHFPQLAGDLELKLDLVCAEMLHCRGEPDPARYRERFPELGAEVDRLLHVYRELGRESCAHLIGPARLSALARVGTGADDSTCPPAPADAAARDGDMPLTLADDYELGELLGVGSFKVVRRARQRSTRRAVAVKVARGGEGATAGQVQRFAREGWTQARLDHQNIPPVFVLGPDPDAPTVLVEKLVPGRPWSDTIAARPLEDNLRILLEVSRALAYAHRQHGVIHRDVKPANVMVGDEYGEVYLVDWGLALHVAAAPERDHPAPHRSEESGISGTPAYMAPEMAAARPDLCTPATDVFLLGAMLYEILTGTAPYGGSARAALVRALAGLVEPPAERAPTRMIPRGLAAVVMKALARDPSERYADAGAFADALQRYLGHAEAERQCGAAERRLQAVRDELGAAGPQHLPPLMTRLIEVADQFRQCRGALAGDAQAEAQAGAGERAAREELVALSLRTGDFALAEAQLEPLAALAEPRRVEALRSEVRRRAVRRRRLKFWLTGLLAIAGVLGVVALALLAHLRDEQARGADLALRAEKEEGERIKAQSQAARERADRAETAQALERERRVRAEDLAAETRRRAAALPLLEKAAMCRAQAFHQAAAVYLAGALQHLDTPELRQAWKEDLQQALVPVATSARRLPIGPLAYSPDGVFLATGDFSGGAVRVWRLRDGEQARVLRGHVPTPELTGDVGALAFDPDAPTRLVSAGGDGTVRVWNVTTGAELSRTAAGAAPLRALAVESGPRPASGRRLATGDLRGNVVWWDLDGLRKVREAPAHKGRTNAVRFRPGAGEYATAGDDGVVHLWDRDGNRLATLPAPPTAGEPMGIVYDLAFSPNGKHLAAGCADGRILVWDVANRRLVRTLDAHREGGKATWARAVAYLDGERILSGGGDGTVRVFDTRDGKELLRRAAHAPNSAGQIATFAVAIHPAGAEWATAGVDGSVWRWNPEGTPTFALEGAQCLERGWLEGTASAFCPATSTVVLAGAGQDAALRVFDAATLREIRTYREPDGPRRWPASCVALHPRGHLFVTGEADGDLALWDVPGGKRLRIFPKAHRPQKTPLGMPIATYEIVWSRDGRRYASVGQENRVKVWDPDAAAPLADWESRDPDSPPPAGLESAADLPPRFTLFDSEGKHLILGGPDHVVRLRDPLTGKVADRLHAHAEWLTAGCLSDDGTLLATGAEDGTIVIWDLARRVPVRTVLLRRLLGVEAPSFEPRAPDPAGRRHPLPIVQWLAWSRDRRLLAVALLDGTLAVVDVGNGEVIARGSGHELQAGQMGGFVPYFLRDGRLLTVGSDGTLRHWDLGAWPHGAADLDARRTARQLACAPDGSEWAAVTAERELVRWRRDGRQLAATRLVDGDRPNAIAYVPRQHALAVGLYGGRSVILDLRTGRVLARHERAGAAKFRENLTVVAVCPRGRTAASNALDASVDLWAVETGAHLRTLRPPGIRRFEGRLCSVAFSPDGRQVAACHEDGSLHIWDPETGELLFGPLWGPGQSEVTCGLAYSPNGSQLAQAGFGEMVVVWDARTGGRLQEIRGHRPLVLGDRIQVLSASAARAAYSVDGRWLATCGGDGTVRLYDARDPGRYRLAAVFSALRLQTYTRLEPHRAGKDRTDSRIALLALAFSPDGDELIAGGWEAPVRRYDLSVALHPFRGSTEVLRDITERVTGQTLAQERLAPRQFNRFVPFTSPPRDQRSEVGGQ